MNQPQILGNAKQRKKPIYDTRSAEELINTVMTAKPKKIPEKENKRISKIKS